jgi:hypothetical protein
MYFFCDKRDLQIITESKVRDIPMRVGYSPKLWIGLLELFLCLMVLCNPIAVYRMSIWALLCTYIVEVYFLWITLI